MSLPDFAQSTRVGSLLISIDFKFTERSRSVKSKTLTLLIPALFIQFYNRWDSFFTPAYGIYRRVGSAHQNIRIDHQSGGRCPPYPTDARQSIDCIVTALNISSYKQIW